MPGHGISNQIHKYAIWKHPKIKTPGGNSHVTGFYYIHPSTSFSSSCSLLVVGGHPEGSSRCPGPRLWCRLGTWTCLLQEASSWVEIIGLSIATIIGNWLIRQAFEIITKLRSHQCKCSVTHIFMEWSWIHLHFYWMNTIIFSHLKKTVRIKNLFLTWTPLTNKWTAASKSLCIQSSGMWAPWFKTITINKSEKAQLQKKLCCAAWQKQFLAPGVIWKCTEEWRSAVVL